MKLLLKDDLTIGKKQFETDQLTFQNFLFFTGVLGA
jgi:hypothetical protein